MRSDKNPVFVEAGKRGAEQRWGPPRSCRLDGLDPDERRVVLAFAELARKRREREAVAEPA